MTMKRQGDLLIIQTTLKKGLTKSKSRIVAYGEITGHKHEVVAKAGTIVFDDIPGKKWVCSKDGFTLVHDEHASLQFPAGDYEIRRQQEYSPQEIRLVAD